MKRITHGFVALLLGLAPAALAGPNQGQNQNQDQNQNQGWTDQQNAWNEQNPSQGQQAQQQPEQSQGEQQGAWQQGAWQQGQQQPSQQQQPPQQPPPAYQGPSRNQPLPPPSQQQPSPPAWQQPMPNAGWQDRSQYREEGQAPMESGPFGASSQGMEGMGPSESDTYEWTMTNGPHLGILVEGMTPELRSYFGVSNDRGVLVARIERHSPASRAGLQVGDVLTAVQGEPVSNANDVLDTLAQLSPGEMIHLDVMRNGRPITLTTQIRPRGRMFHGQRS